MYYINNMKKRKYILELDEEQAMALRDAAEVCARIGMYQLHDICRFLPDKTEQAKKNYDAIYQDFWDMYLKYTRDGMSDYEKPEISKILWDLYQVIRHKIAWDNNPKGDSMSVMFDTPMRTANNDLAKITDALDNLKYSKLDCQGIPFNSEKGKTDNEKA